MKIQAVKGMNDVGPEDSPLWHYIENTVRELYHRFYFSEIRTPVLEPLSLFQRGVGSTTDIVEKEMYSFEDQGGDHLALRPEGTAAIVRAVVQHNWLREYPVLKAYYLAPMFRRERPQKGRYRQHHQFGLEIFGVDGPEADLEILSVQHMVFQQLGLSQVELHLSSVGCRECRPPYREALLKLLNPLKDKLCSDCQRRMVTNPLRVFDCKVPTCQAVTAGLPKQIDYLCDGCEQHLVGLKRGLDALNIPYQMNPRIVRGIDYYTRTSFEFVGSSGLGSQATLCGGGRYDHLVEQLGGASVSGVGCGMGLERLVLLLEEEKSQHMARPDAYVVAADSAGRELGRRLAYELRQRGMTVEHDIKGRSLKAQFKQANKLNARWCIIIGEEEASQNQAQLKNMVDSQQETVALKDLPEELSRRLKEK